MPKTFDIEIGLDLHKDFSMLAAIDASGEFLGYQKLSNDTGLFDLYFRTFKSKSFRVTLESTKGTYWLIDYLTDQEIPFIVSNPFLNRAIANVHAKNDKYDARKLARSAYFMLKKNKPYQFRRIQSQWSQMIDKRVTGT